MNQRPNLTVAKKPIYEEKALLAGGKARGIFEMMRPLMKRIYDAIENSNERDVADAIMALKDGDEQLEAQKLASALRKARFTRDVSRDVVVMMEAITMLASGRPTEAEALLENYERYGDQLPG